MNDADIEMAELEAAASRNDALRRNGICPHTWTKGKPGPGLQGPHVCLDCGFEMATNEDLFDAQAFPSENQR